MTKVLVVDNNKITTDMTKEILDVEGYECVTANDGKQCLDLLKNEKFDVLLLDLAMPVMSGINVLAALRKQSDLIPFNRILLFTASPQFSETDTGKLKKEYCIGGCITKPFIKNELLETIRNILQT